MEGALQKYFGSLKTIFSEILAIKNENDEELAKQIVEKKTLALLLFVLIKKINRTVKYEIRLGRDDLQRGKLSVESNRLQLQNLFYEVNYLNREIRRCYQFKSQDEDIDLLSEEEYLKMVSADDIPTTEHEKRLSRLEWELNYRKQLSKQSIELLDSKKLVFQDIVTKMERLTSFSPSLRSLLDATQPLQESLQVPLSSNWKIEQLVKLLPQPLYLIYMNIHALENVLDPKIRVTIVGSEKDVHSAETEDQLEFLKCQMSNEVLSKDKWAERSYLKEQESGKSANTGLSMQFLKTHPLAVRVTIGDESNEFCTVIMHCFHKLGLVTASAEVHIKDKDDAFNELPLSANILSNLYPNDEGEEIPIPNVLYKLQNYGSSIQHFLNLIEENKRGKPYRWLQAMCGFEVASIEKEENVTTLLQRTILDVIKRLQTAWISRLNLIAQVKGLVNKNIDLYLRNDHPLSKVACSFLQWSSISWEEYKSKNFTREYVSSKLVNKNNMFYRALVVRGSAKMECLVHISSGFPEDSPIWVICIYWNGEHNSSNNSAIKMMEYYTNIVQQNEMENEFSLLSFQLVRTMSSFDIFLETEGPCYTPLEYNKEKNFVKAFAKRCRARPYRFIKNGPVNVFKQ